MRAVDFTKDLIAVEKIDVDDKGERFHIVYYDAEKRATQSGYIRDTRGPLREQEIRDFFTKGGQPADEVEEMFRSARANYRG